MKDKYRYQIATAVEEILQRSVINLSAISKTIDMVVEKPQKERVKLEMAMKLLENLGVAINDYMIKHYPEEISKEVHCDKGEIQKTECS